MQIPQVERIESRRDLERLRPEWDALWSSIPGRTPFQSSDWLLPWWDVFRPGRLCVRAFRIAGRLVAIAPLYASGDMRRPELRLFGAGVSDYLDVLVAADARTPVTRALTAALAEDLAEWSFCGFDHLRPGSPLLDIRPPDQTDDVVIEDEPCPALRLPDSMDALQAAAGTRILKNVRNQRSRAERAGGFEIQRVRDDSVQSALDALFSLHGARWAARGEGGVLEDDAVREFHRVAGPRLLDAGLLRSFIVRIGSRIAGVHYGLHAGDTTCFYIGGFDPDFAAFGPGTLAVAAAIEHAIREGARSFDFLAGQEAYKYQWGATDRPRVSRHLRRLPARRVGNSESEA